MNNIITGFIKFHNMVRKMVILTELWTSKNDLGEINEFSFRKIRIKILYHLGSQQEKLG